MGDLIRRKLRGMFLSIFDFSSKNAREANYENAEGDEMIGKKKTSGAAIANLVSITAMVFSAFSFYETALKQASLTYYPPGLIQMYREGFRDVLAIPVTISNDGAQRGTILSFNLKVTNLETKETKEFQNLYFGDNPKGTDKKLFSPITIPGRNSYNDVILFHAIKTGSFVKTTGGVKLPLRLTLSMNTDGSKSFLGEGKTKEITFDMTASYIQGFRNMESGSPTVLYNKRWHEANKAAKN